MSSPPALHHGDNRDLLPEILDGLAERYVVLITDPPYVIRNRFGKMQCEWAGVGRRMEFGFDADTTVAEVIATLRSPLKVARSAHVFCGVSQVSPLEEAMADVGMVPKPWAWVKLYPPPAAPGNWWPSAFELALYGYRSGAFFRDPDVSRRNVWTGDSLRHGNREKCGHPTQKPLALMRHLVRSICPPDGVVLDPYAGSGSTLVAALQEGREAIGIEIDERWCGLAEERLAQGVLL